jgi:hypothetical protein
MKFCFFKNDDKLVETASSLPVNREIIFTNHKNIYKKRVEKHQKHLLGYIPFIKSFLIEDEELLLITTCCSPVTFCERFWTGLNVFCLKHSLLVFTNKRVFHIPTRKNYTYRDSIANFFYADCSSMAVKNFILTVTYKSGKKEKFHHISHREEKKLKSLVKSISFEGSQVNSDRVHLCPGCTSELVKDVYTCPACGLEFKDRKSARKFSFAYPGGGYFYTRHYILGIGDALLEITLLALVIAFIARMANGKPFSGYGLLISAGLLIFEKLLTVYHSCTFIKEYIPKEKKIIPRSGSK